MGYGEIIMLGYVLNVTAMVIMVALSILMTLMSYFFKDTLTMMEETKNLQSTSAEFRLKSKNVPFKVYSDWKSYGKFFPFGYVFEFLNFLYYGTRYGPTVLVTAIVQIKIDKIDAYNDYLKEQEE